MLFSKLEKYINWEINSYLKKNDWKQKFTNEVIPQINKGWKLVANDEYGPCINCYAYGNGSTINCNQSINRYIRNHDLTIFMSFDEYKKLTPLNVYFNNASDYQRYEIVFKHTLNAYFSYGIIHRVVPLIE